MTPEKRILEHLKRESKRLGLRYHRIHTGPGVEVGWPDAEILGPRRGILFVETKRLGKPISAVQKLRRDEIQSYGHWWCKPDTKEDVTRYLEMFLEQCNG